MAINKNHEFEELNGVKCAIVEKNASPERVAFLKLLLEFNKYTVIVVTAAAPKPAVAAKPIPQPQPQSQPQPSPVLAEPKPQPNPQPDPQPQPQPIPQPEPSPQPPPEPQPPAPEMFTIGVTDVTFNPTNAIFGRMLHTKDGHVVTQAYWQQKENVSHDEVPYFGAVVK